MSLLPVIALVGRTNVGKSTLFNRLTRSRSALVADIPGLTRDRQYGRGRVGDRPFIVIDTGGFEPDAKSGVYAQMARQTRQAVIEADMVFFVVDGREGLTAHDEEIAAELRRRAQRVMLVVNKAEGRPRDQVVAEFHVLGLGDPVAVSAAHGDNVRQLVEAALGLFPYLLSIRDRKAGALSGGQQQMLAIGRALMQQPHILLLDEPSMGLAPLLVEEIFNIVQRLNQERGTTILLVEQNAQAALQVAHRGYVLETGMIAISGDAKDLLQDPRVIEAYLGL